VGPSHAKQLERGRELTSWIEDATAANKTIESHFCESHFCSPQTIFHAPVLRLPLTGTLSQFGLVYNPRNGCACLSWGALSRDDLAIASLCIIPSDRKFYATYRGLPRSQYRPYRIWTVVFGLCWVSVDGTCNEDIGYWKTIVVSKCQVSDQQFPLLPPYLSNDGELVKDRA
jgi:hypothetical protein